MAKLKRSFFLQSDVVHISKQLLGKYVFTRLRSEASPGQARLRSDSPAEVGTTPRQACANKKVLTGGIITETEAYAGPEDRASHAYGNRRTERNEVMFHKGGVAYVYLCYGIHSLFNIITNVEGIPHAVLVRAVQPTHGIETMLKRRGKKRLDRSVAGGPGALTNALGIDTGHNGETLVGSRIWLEDRGYSIRPSHIQAGPRVGVAYAGIDAKHPWRFRIRNSPWCSSAS